MRRHVNNAPLRVPRLEIIETEDTQCIKFPKGGTVQVQIVSSKPEPEPKPEPERHLDRVDEKIEDVHNRLEHLFEKLGKL